MTPCIKVCRLDPTRTHCEGCFRTPSDLKDWYRHTDNVQSVVEEQFQLTNALDLESFSTGFLQGYYYARLHPHRKRLTP